MTVETFVEELAKNAPDLEQYKKNLEARGFTFSKSSRSVYESYFLPKKTNNTIKSNYLLIDLINNYDCSNFEFGIMTLFDKPTIRGEYISFGELEAEEFAIHRKYKYIALLEHETYYTTEWMLCAKDETSFLESILMGAEYWSLFYIQNSAKASNEELAKLSEDYIKKCTQIAGGVDYQRFFNYWLGQ